ncbi:MAG TPA: metalloregulator ArsR/SmtB family transcription factor [Bacillota bacterium]|nr:metalloregulator ArsR/SmtB family transcription factor [Bacillota bacterium]
MILSNKAKVHESSAYDFLSSLMRIENNEAFAPQEDPDRFVSEWSDQARGKMPVTIRNSLAVFFSRETGYAMSLAGYIARARLQDAAAFLDYIKELPPEEILVHFLYTGIGPGRETSSDDVKAMTGNDKAAVAFINEHLTFTPREKWQMLQFLLDPPAMKRELLVLLDWHFSNLYAEIESDVASFVTKYSRELSHRIDKYGDEYIRLLLPVDYSKRSDATVTMAVSRFTETGSSFDILSDLLVCGYRYADEVADQHAIMAGSKIFKTLADETRLQILRLLAEKPWYGHELATRLNLTNSTISHHVSMLSYQGLIRAYREDNKVYFQLDRADFLESVQNAARRVISDDQQ